MARATAEVLLGPGTHFAAPNGTAFPADPTVAPLAAFEDMGYSEAGWNVVADLTYEFFTPAEEIDPIATIKMAQEIHIRGIAVQFTQENLKLALGGGVISTDVGPPATQTYTPPVSDQFDFFASLFRTKAPESSPGATDTRDVRIPRVISVSSLDIPHTKGANPSALAIDFQAIKETGQDIFDIEETTAGGS